MKRITTLLLVWGILAASQVATVAQLTDEMKKEGWVALFDGKTLEGWKSNEKYEGFKVEDGCIKGFGDRNHLYYMKEEFKNFELMLDIKINDKGNSGVFFKSQWEEGTWPISGFEVQVNATHGDPIKTGSLWGLVNIPKAPHDIDKWFTMHIICKGNSVEIRIDRKTLYTYVDPREDDGPQGAITPKTRRISQKGYINLQAHDPGSFPMFKNIFVKKLPD